MSRVISLDKLEIKVTLKEEKEIQKTVDHFNQALSYYKKAYSSNLPDRKGSKVECQHQLMLLEKELKKAKVWSQRMKVVAERIVRFRKNRGINNLPADKYARAAFDYIKRLEHKIEYGPKEIPLSGNITNKSQKRGALQIVWELQRFMKKSYSKVDVVEANKLFGELHLRAKELHDYIEYILKLEAEEFRLNQQKN